MISTVGKTGGSGAVYCWGGNGYGQVGNGQATDTVRPVSPSGGITDALQVSAGLYTTCALRADTTVWCWGYGAYGEMGDGSNALVNPTPHQVQVAPGVPLVGVSSVSVGSWHACASVRSSLDPTVPYIAMCWGWNGHGELGTGDTQTMYFATATGASSKFTDIAGTPIPLQISAGDEHTCAVKEPGTNQSTVICWGWNNHGQTQPETKGIDRLAPEFTVVTYTDAIDGRHLKVVAGHWQTQLVFSKGTAFQWGFNPAGVDPPHAQDHLLIAGGQIDTTISDVLLSWYDNFFQGRMHSATGNAFQLTHNTNGSGQLGTGVFGCANGCSLVTPIDVNNLSFAQPTQYSTGIYHACAMHDVHQVFCWGLGNNGRLGNGFMTNRVKGDLVLGGPW